MNRLVSLFLFVASAAAAPNLSTRYGAPPPGFQGTGSQGTGSQGIGGLPLGGGSRGMMNLKFGDGCAMGLMKRIDGSCGIPVISRNVFTYSPPPQQVLAQKKAKMPEPKVNLNLMFVRTPSTLPGYKPMIVPPPMEKNLVYVLNRRPAVQEIQEIIEMPSVNTQPEVFFVNYEREDDNPLLPGGISLQEALNHSTQPGGFIDTTGGLTTISGGSTPGLTSELSSPGLTSGISFPGQTSGISPPGPTSGISSPGFTSGISPPGFNTVISPPGFNSGISSPGFTSGISSPGSTSGISSHGSTSGGIRTMMGYEYSAPSVSSSGNLLGGQSSGGAPSGNISGGISSGNPFGVVTNAGMSSYSS